MTAVAGDRESFDERGVPRLHASRPHRTGSTRRTEARRVRGARGSDDPCRGNLARPADMKPAELTMGTVSMRPDELPNALPWLARTAAKGIRRTSAAPLTTEHQRGGLRWQKTVHSAYHMGITTQATGNEHPRSAYKPTGRKMKRQPHDGWPHRSAGSPPCRASP
jgi:hypothetical protein